MPGAPSEQQSAGTQLLLHFPCEVLLCAGAGSCTALLWWTPGRACLDPWPCPGGVSVGVALPGVGMVPAWSVGAVPGVALPVSAPSAEALKDRGSHLMCSSSQHLGLARKPPKSPSVWHVRRAEGARSAQSHPKPPPWDHVAQPPLLNLSLCPQSPLAMSPPPPLTAMLSVCQSQCCPWDLCQHLAQCKPTPG